MGGFLREKKNDHLNWMHKVKDVFLDSSKNRIDVEMDPAKCGLGQWLASDQVRLMREQHPDFSALIDKVVGPHEKLHQSAEHINALLAGGKRAEAIDYYRANTAEYAAQTLAALDNVIAWHDEHIKGMREADRIFATETKPNLEKVQSLLKQINETVASRVMTDQRMLQSASRTRMAVLVFGLLTIVIGMGLSIVIVRGITGPLRRIIAALNEGAG